MGIPPRESWAGAPQSAKPPVPPKAASANQTANQTPTGVRLRLLRSGYRPLPLQGKNPSLSVNGDGWQTKRRETNPDEIRLWEQFYRYATNTGVLCRDTPFLDLDILDPDAAEAAVRLVKERFAGHPILTRIGLPPKRAIPFQTATPFSKIKVDLLLPDGTDTRGEKIELLCDGQQCVVDGIHPDTRQPYRWHGGVLGEVARGDLPVIDAATGRKLVEDIAALLVRAHGYKLKNKPKPSVGNGIHQDPQGGIREGDGPADWDHYLANLIEHDDDAGFAMALLRTNMSDGAAVNLMRAHSAVWKMGTKRAYNGVCLKSPAWSRRRAPSSARKRKPSRPKLSPRSRYGVDGTPYGRSQWAP